MDSRKHATPIVAGCCVAVVVIVVMASVLWVQQQNRDQDVTIAQHNAEIALICARQEQVLTILGQISRASIGVQRRAPQIPAEVVALQRTPCALAILHH